MEFLVRTRGLRSRNSASFFLADVKKALPVRRSEDPLPDSDHNDVEKRGVALFHALKRDPPMRSRGSADRDYSRRRALEWHGVKCRPRPVSSETYLPSYRP